MSHWKLSRKEPNFTEIRIMRLMLEHGEMSVKHITNIWKDSGKKYLTNTTELAAKITRSPFFEKVDYNEVKQIHLWYINERGMEWIIRADKE